MIELASTWLGLAIALSAVAWFARWPAAVLLPISTVAAALALFVPLGDPKFTTPPPGDYSVVGADIDVGNAIYVLLKNGSGPAVYYKLPYSTSKANELQGAMDATEGQGGVSANVDGEGGVSYDGEPPVTETAPKAPETPQFSF